MKLVKLTEKHRDKYEAYAKKHAFSTIHQSFAWGDFQRMIPGRGESWILGVMDDKDEFLGSALIYKNSLPFNLSWLYCPRGPLFDFVDKEVFEKLMEGIKEIAKEEKAVFLRVDPPVEKDGKGLQYAEKFLKEYKFKPAHAEFQPSTTLMIDLKQSEEEILAGMKQKGRYNIKVARKKGVTVRKSDGSEKDYQDFYNLLKDTASRDKFAAHDKDFYVNMMEALGDNAEMFLAEKGAKVIAGIIVTYFGDTATYYFGASGNEYRNLMAPYLLQFHAIKAAKEKGQAWYDFLGIAPENAGNDHPLFGVTEFKKKFGGKVVDFMKAKEFVYKPFWYFVMKMRKKVG